MREQDRGKIKTPFMLAFSVGAVPFTTHARGGKAIDTCQALPHSTPPPLFNISNNCFNLCFLYKPWHCVSSGWQFERIFFFKNSAEPYLY